MLTLFQKDIFLKKILNAPYVGTGTDVNLFLKDLYDENNWFDNIACLNNNTIYKIYKTVLVFSLQADGFHNFAMNNKNIDGDSDSENSIKLNDR